MNRPEAIQAALDIFYAHRQVRPPEGECICGLTIPLGHIFMHHVFVEIFNTVLDEEVQP